MDLQKLFELADVDTSKGKAKALLEQQAANTNTRVVLSGDEYVIPGSWDAVRKHLGSNERAYINMMINDDECEIGPTSDQPNASIQTLVTTIIVGTTSAEMDHWTPP